MAGVGLRTANTASLAGSIETGKAQVLSDLGPPRESVGVAIDTNVRTSAIKCPLRPVAANPELCDSGLRWLRSGSGFPARLDRDHVPCSRWQGLALWFSGAGCGEVSGNLHPRSRNNMGDRSQMIHFLKNTAITGGLHK